MTTAKPIDLADFNFYNPELLEDPYPTYRYMLEHHPVHFSPMFGGTWMFLRYEDSKNLLRDPRVSSSNRVDTPFRSLSEHQRAEFAETLALFSEWTAFMDRPEHTTHRKHLNRVFACLTEESLTPLVEGLVDELLEPLRGRRHVDFMKEVGTPLPALIMCHLLGVPRAEADTLIERSDTIVHIYATNDLRLEELRAAREKAFEHVEYLDELTQSFAFVDHETLLSRALSIDVDGFSPSRLQVFSEAIVLTFAGINPPRCAIGNSMLALAGNPDQQELLRRDTSMLPAAIEEFLRFDAPGHFIGRVAGESFSYQGADIQKGQVVLPYVAAANRDPARFRDPDTVDITRHDNQHLSLGYGMHYCVGANLFRIQCKVLLRKLLEEFPAFGLDPDRRTVWNGDLGLRGPISVPLVFE